MEVRCEQCQARYRVDDARVGPQGLMMRCGKCRNTFRVTREGPQAATPATQVAAPAAATTTPASPPAATSASPATTSRAPATAGSSPRSLAIGLAIALAVLLLAALLVVAWKLQTGSR